MASGVEAEVGVEKRADTIVLTLFRPEHGNSLTTSLVDLLADCVESAVAEGARAIVLTGAPPVFCVGGDLAHLKGVAEHGARAVTDMIYYHFHRRLLRAIADAPIPVIAAVNGPAVGLGCSLVALSDVVYIAEKAFLSDPHVQVGLVAADGGPLTWPLHTSLLFAKEYALTGARIPATRAVEMGLANHVVDDPLAEAIACAERVAALPQQAVESTKRLLNIHLERAVLAVLDYANTAEDMSLQTDDLRANIARLSKAT